MSEYTRPVSLYRAADGAICVTGHYSVTVPDYWLALDLRLYGDRIVLEPVVTVLREDIDPRGGVNGYLRATLTPAARSTSDIVWGSAKDSQHRFEFAKASLASSAAWLEERLGDFLSEAAPILEAGLREEVAALEKSIGEIRELAAFIPEWMPR